MLTLFCKNLCLKFCFVTNGKCKKSYSWHVRGLFKLNNYLFIIYHKKILKVQICDGRESNPNQLLGRQLC